ncbi:MAG: MerR family DNA-binding protein, partial [Coleofasciculaceae cyanobacterium SM2_3_26]|nr:MerR family DNA-binding protein [Coleofasciculaceae cyanobacterium SM2_3_26]
NYKEYGEETVERLWLIAQAKSLGFTLREIEQAIADWQNGNLSQREKIQIFEDKITQIDAKIQKLHDVRAYLISKLEKVKVGIL